jgi:2-polyprenyl-3-methyl-5-hydroxy-6-metoxy-1,4-benzoquinol methylase
MTVSQFYDDLSAYYDLIYADWEGSMARQGLAIHQILRAEFPETAAGGLRVLDVASGIGTQAIPLAQQGYQVVARDLSPGAVARLSQEARIRGLQIDSAVADMREVSGSVEGPFDAVLAMDNSVPHLPTDREIVTAFHEFRRLLADRGRLLISVRDYEKVDRAPTSTHPYGKRTRDGKTYRLEQRWEWVDPEHYSATFLFEEFREGAWSPVLRSQAEYYAIPKPRLLSLMNEAGFEPGEVTETPFFQPVLVGRLAD